jgi:hypothetical protein
MQKAMHADRHNGCQRAEYCSGEFEDSDPTRGVLPAPKVALANLTRDDPYPFVAYLVISWVYIRGRWILSSAWWRVEKVASQSLRGVPGKTNSAASVFVRSQQVRQHSHTYIADHLRRKASDGRTVLMAPDPSHISGLTSEMNFQVIELGPAIYASKYGSTRMFDP